MVSAPSASRVADTSIARWNDWVDASLGRGHDLGRDRRARRGERLDGLSDHRVGRRRGPARARPASGRTVALTTMNSAAPANGAPTREMALLMAEPRPTLRSGIEAISAVVRGATTSDRPRPKTTEDGQDVDEVARARHERRRVPGGWRPRARWSPGCGPATGAPRPWSAARRRGSGGRRSWPPPDRRASTARSAGRRPAGAPDRPPAACSRACPAGTGPGT